MEKRLTREELLENLINQLQDPFCSPEKYNDIQTILFQSDTFNGLNHLFLADLFLKNDRSLFRIDEKEAERQISLALKEGNKAAYYFFYLFHKQLGNATKARNYLRISYDLGLPDAYIAMGQESIDGTLFPKDLSFAYACFKRAVLSGKKEGHYYLLLVDTILGNKKKAEEDYQKAKEDGYVLPGVVE